MKINFFAPLNFLGFGIHAYNTIREFERRGHHVTVTTPNGTIGRSDEHIDRWTKNRETIDVARPGIMIFHEHFLTQFAGAPRIGFPVFELERFDAVQLAAMRTCDYLFTPSEWGARVLKANGLANKARQNIYVVNEGFDPEIFPFFERSEAEERGEPFTFIHVGKFEERKGTLQAVDCFFRALEKETARLVLHIHNPFNPDYSALEKLIHRLGFISTNGGQTWRRMGLSIHITSPVPIHSEMSHLYRRADCGLYPSRAEGWGLPILETLATGVPCIVGDWTGQSEYLESYPGYAIEPLAGAERVPAKDDLWFDGTRGDWWRVRDGFLIGRIRDAFHDARALRARDHWRAWVSKLREKFTWARAAERLEGVLEDILGV